MRSKNMCTSISPRIPSRYQYAANDYLHEDESCNMHYLFSKKICYSLYMLHVSLLQMTDMKTIHNQHTTLNYKTVSKGSYINYYTSVAANEFSMSTLSVMFNLLITSLKALLSFSAFGVEYGSLSGKR